jgi:hypothetical protein
MMDASEEPGGAESAVSMSKITPVRSTITIEMGRPSSDAFIKA